MDKYYETINAHINDDVEGLFDTTQKVEAELNAQAIINLSKEIPLFVTSAAENLIQKIDDTGTYTYVGLAIPQSTGSQAVWKIKRIDLTGNLLFAAGVATFTQVWDNRASLSYS